MKPLLWLAPPLILALSFLSGTTWPGRPEEPSAVVRGQAARNSAVVRPGEGVVAAVAFLKTLRSDPPPDVAVTFRAALRGVERDPATGQRRALVTTDSGGVGALAEGARFGDGWRIKDITAEAVTLAKGRETRVVRVFG